MLDPALRLAIANELGRIGTMAPVLRTRVATSKLYELFILTCLVQALNRLDARLEARDQAGLPTTDLIFRLGPGTLRAPSSSPGFIYALVNNVEYEIQNGLLVAGHSRVLHELDVCLIKRENAIRCRRERTDPSASAVKFLAECKCYGESLDLSLGREYVGLASEFRLRGKTLVSNVSSESLHALVTGHNGTVNAEIEPFEPQRVEDFIGWLKTELQQILF